MSVTCCPLSSSDDEGPSWHREEVRKAARDHRCCECRETISKGADHQYIVGLWDGVVESFRTCLSCAEIREHFACDGYVLERLWEDLEDNFFPDMRAGGPCMEGMSPEAKARLFERRMAWYEERQ